MTPASFRRDRWLRTSAYHLATWSLAAFVLEIRFRSVGPASEATGVSALVVIVAASLLTSMTTERRVAKMVGPAGEPVYAAAGRMWAMVLAMLAPASAGLMLASRPEAVITLWMVGVGAAFVFWGRRSGFSWYVGLGLTIVAAAAVDAWMSAFGGPVVLFRVFVLGLALPAAAIATNRRFLWFRAPA